MNMDKRYCQNRGSKRKRQPGIENWCVVNENISSASIEEERQFKLSRFVKDVNKFVQEKEQCSDKNHTRRSSKETVAALKKTVKTVIPSKPMAKMGMFRNGVQTKFYTRGMMGKEMTARLDEDLHQIIALATNNNKENECQCSHQKTKPPPVLQQTASTPYSVDREPLHTLTTRTPTRAERWTEERLQTTPQSEGKAARLAQLDRELYPDFVGVISNSAVKTMTSCFSGISYLSTKKKELLNIYLRDKRENTQESVGLSETQKSSVATSPIQSPISLSGSSPAHNMDNGMKDTFTLNFVPEPCKSFIQMLEETTNPGPSYQNVLSVPLEQRERLSPSPPQHSRQYRSLPSQPPSFQHHFDQPSPVPSYLISPPVNHNSLIKFKPNRYQSSRPRFSTFLPNLDEESPEFQRYPHFLF